MKFYKTISRKRSIDDTSTIADLFGNHRRFKRNIAKIIDFFESSQNFAIKKEIIKSGDDVKEFYESLYVPFIQNKKTPNIINIPESIQKGIESKQYVFMTISDDEQLIGGTIASISSNDKKFYSLAWSAQKQGYDGIVQYLEYLFFKDALEKQVDVIGMGTTANISGSVQGSPPGVLLHKIEYGFIPYVNHKKDPLYTDVNPETFVDDTLIFLSSDDVRFDAVDVYTDLPPGIREEKYSLLAKRGLQVTYKPLAKK